MSRRECSTTVHVKRVLSAYYHPIMELHQLVGKDIILLLNGDDRTVID